MQINESKNYELITILNHEVHKLHCSLYPEYFKEYDFNAIEEFFKGIIDHPNFKFLILEDDGQYLGYAWIEFKDYSENAFRKSYKSVYVHQLSIAETKRGNGYGTKMMEKITEIAEMNRIKKIELDYWSNNEVAKNFYNKLGYKKYREFAFKEL